MDTIIAISTPLGRGGIGIIRLSGRQAVTMAQALMAGAFPKPRVAAYRSFLDAEGNVLDKGLVLYFPKPHSFTGEDVVELQGHGSPPVLNALLNHAVLQGARLARPGEFSERAFLNNRLDLAQAEAISDLIHAGSEQAARAAMRSLQGVFSKRVASIEQALIHLRTLVEAAIDFSDEEIEIASKQAISDQIEAILHDLQHLEAQARCGQRLQEGMQLVMAGTPNVGKSSLLNALSHEDIAITSDVPGTTRDILTTHMMIDGLPIHVLDTAGLHQTENKIEQEGMRRAIVAIEKADQILWIVDSTLSKESVNPYQRLAEFTPMNIQKKITVIRNKIDLSQESPGITLGTVYDVVRVSALTGAGLDRLKSYLKNSVGYDDAIGFSARERHVIALIRVKNILQRGLTAWHDQSAFEILALHLTEAHRALGEITGIFTTEDLLGHIFSTFCIGK